MRKIVLLIFLSIFFQRTGAQTSTVKKAQLGYDKAQDYLRDNRYDLAVAALQEAVKADPSFQFAFIQLGEINRRLKAYEAAKNAYQSALQIGSPADPRMYYGLTESELNTGDYSNALQHIKLFITQYKGSDEDFLSKANKYLKDCEFSIKSISTPQKYEPVSLGQGVNSTYRDYFPSITADGERLIFSRNIDGNEDFYISTLKNNNWAEAVPLSSNINTVKYNEGAQSISPDGSYLFFTGCNRPDGLGRCDIYVSHKDGNNWGKPFNLGAPINTNSWESQPAIAPDGNTLYFVSNRPGGMGGYDIWKSVLKSDGYWSDPENLGPDINTPYDEHTPFIHPDGKTLYFSSDGWPGLGNKDIFLSRLDASGRWGKPENMGYPINTFNEETGLIVSPDGSTGLFSSMLKGGYGDMDIYQFKMPLDKKPLPITYVKGIVRDKTSGNFMEAKIQVMRLNDEHLVYSDYTSKDNGDFLAVMPMGGNYAFDVSAPGYLFYSQNYELTNATISNPFTVEIYLEKITVGTNLILKNIFFNTNEFSLLPASVSELTTLTDLLLTNKNFHIEIQGHTDNVGNDVANEKLSDQRAKAVYDYLIKNEIDPLRLTYKGYGETKPIAANDTEANRKLNRRTSFMVTKL